MEDDSNLGYEKLMVWQRSIEWSCTIINISEELKTDRKHYRLIEQLESASTSVAMNIAEGKGRYSKKEFVQFLFIARGSLYETVTLLEIFHRQEWLESAIFRKLKSDATEIAKMLNSLINSIKSPQTRAMSHEL
jgi:S23 ribosomal protein.